MASRIAQARGRGKAREGEAPLVAGRGPSWIQVSDPGHERMDSLDRDHQEPHPKARRGPWVRIAESVGIPPLRLSGGPAMIPCLASPVNRWLRVAERTILLASEDDPEGMTFRFASSVAESLGSNRTFRGASGSSPWKRTGTVTMSASRGNRGPSAGAGHLGQYRERRRGRAGNSRQGWSTERPTLATAHRSGCPMWGRVPDSFVVGKSKRGRSNRPLRVVGRPIAWGADPTG